VLGIAIGAGLVIALIALIPFHIGAAQVDIAKSGGCIRWPEAGAWALYRIDGYAFFVPIYGWMRVYSNGTHAIYYINFMGNLTFGAMKLSEFNFTKMWKGLEKNVRVGAKQILALKPIDAEEYKALYQGNTYVLYYIDKQTGLLAAATFKGPKSKQGFSYGFSIILWDTNICGLKP